VWSLNRRYAQLDGLQRAILGLRHHPKSSDSRGLFVKMVATDGRDSAEAALARMVGVFDAADLYLAYLFARRRVNRTKLHAHDDIGVRLAG